MDFVSVCHSRCIHSATFWARSIEGPMDELMMERAKRFSTVPRTVIVNCQQAGWRLAVDKSYAEGRAGGWLTFREQ